MTFLGSREILPPPRENSAEIAGFSNVYNTRMTTKTIAVTVMEDLSAVASDLCGGVSNGAGELAPETPEALSRHRDKASHEMAAS